MSCCAGPIKAAEIVELDSLPDEVDRHLVGCSRCCTLLLVYIKNHRLGKIFTLSDGFVISQETPLPQPTRGQ